MEELIKLLGLVADDKKADAQKLVDTVKAKITALDTEIGTHERQKLDAIKSRDEIKGKLKDIGTKLGIDIDTENVVEAIEAIKSKKGVDKTEALTIAEKEVEQLKAEITTLAGTMQEKEAQAQKQILGVTLKGDIAKALPKFKAKASATEHIISAIERRAVFENGKVTFKNDDGTTYRINGADATVDNIVEEMQLKEKTANESMFFDISVQKSGAEGGGTKVEDDFIP